LKDNNKFIFFIHSQQYSIILLTGDEF
jgi:hypothetical protein